MCATPLVRTPWLHKDEDPVGRIGAGQRATGRSKHGLGFVCSTQEQHMTRQRVQISSTSSVWVPPERKLSAEDYRALQEQGVDMRAMEQLLVGGCLEAAVRVLDRRAVLAALDYLRDAKGWQLAPGRTTAQAMASLQVALNGEERFAHLRHTEPVYQLPGVRPLGIFFQGTSLPGVAECTFGVATSAKAWGEFDDRRRALLVVTDPVMPGVFHDGSLLVTINGRRATPARLSTDTPRPVYDVTAAVKAHPPKGLRIRILSHTPAAFAVTLQKAHVTWPLTQARTRRPPARPTRVVSREKDASGSTRRTRYVEVEDLASAAVVAAHCERKGIVAEIVGTRRRPAGPSTAEASPTAAKTEPTAPPAPSEAPDTGHISICDMPPDAWALRPTDDRGVDSGDDLAVTETRFSRRCPLTHRRMKRPCLGSECEHHQHVEQQAMLDQARTTGGRQCPVCRKPVRVLWLNRALERHFARSTDDSYSPAVYQAPTPEE